MKEKKFTPEEIVFSRGEVANKLIFILSGELQIYAKHDNQRNSQIENRQYIGNKLHIDIHDSNEPAETLLRTFKGGFCIGEREFATTRMYEYSARAT